MKKKTPPPHRIGATRDVISNARSVEWVHWARTHGRHCDHSMQPQRQHCTYFQCVRLNYGTVQFIFYWPRVRVCLYGVYEFERVNELN